MLCMIGIDLVFIPEFQQQLDSGGKTFIDKAFNMSELKNHKTEHLAGLWAAKEAVIKAAPETPKKMTDIVISHDGSGKPAAKFNSDHYEISIAHHGDYAIAVAHKADA
jgi:phosphopantetheine--protein transferase-like protein